MFNPNQALGNTFCLIKCCKIGVRFQINFWSWSLVSKSCFAHSSVKSGIKNFTNTPFKPKPSSANLSPKACILPQFLVPRILFLHQNLTKNPCFAPFSLSIWLSVHDFSSPQKQLLAAKKHIFRQFSILKSRLFVVFWRL